MREFGTCARRLTAIDAGRAIIRHVLAVGHGAPDQLGIAPDHLREVQEAVVLRHVGAAVGVDEFFLVPAVDAIAGHLNPEIVCGGGRADAGEVAAGAVLYCGFVSAL